ncbi:hypothetical protein RF11_15303 [Thelohanellus kitauei]|uniref:Uncharacterized protein n=1 Tax=Thelohanellus kitauei TaxID=669202 RepID=A0A0C2JY82_THEKT|nr:hypothetical protein RF11_15303 [Thelohanellus kitauei]
MLDYNIDVEKAEGPTNAGGLPPTQLGNRLPNDGSNNYVNLKLHYQKLMLTRQRSAKISRMPKFIKDGIQIKTQDAEMLYILEDLLPRKICTIMIRWMCLTLSQRT